MASRDYNQPIHQVLSDYALLEVAPCDDVRFTLDQPLSWRMNLCAISQLYPTKYFIAVNNKICVYGITGSLVFTRQPIMVLKPSTEPDFMINAIKLGAMKLSPDGSTDEILVAVGDNGEIFAWNTYTLFSSSTTNDDDTKPFFHQHNVGVPPADDDDNIDNNSDDASTWGIAMHVDGLLAVSANNHRITIYNLWASTSSSSPLQRQQQQQQQRQNRLGERTHVELAGHVHNIPCVDFDSSGRYLASGSIDMTCRLWDLATLRQVGNRFITRTQDSDAWLWGIKFIPPGCFKSATCNASSPLIKTLKRHVNQGRAIGTTDLHMEHSAAYPIYQLDMHQMFHRLNTQDLTDDDDDDDGDNNNAAPNHLLRLSTLLSRHLLRANIENDNDDENDGYNRRDDDGDDGVGVASPFLGVIDGLGMERGQDEQEQEDEGWGSPGANGNGGDNSRWGFRDVNGNDGDGSGWLLNNEPVTLQSLATDDNNNNNNNDDNGPVIDSLHQQRLDDDAADAGLLDWGEYGVGSNDDHVLWDSSGDDDDDNNVGDYANWHTNGNQLMYDNDDTDNNDYLSPGSNDDDDEAANWHDRHEPDLDARHSEIDDAMEDDLGYPLIWDSDGLEDNNDNDNDNNDFDVLPPVEWNGNQRENYDDLLAEEEGWMQDRAQFPWHWLGIRSGGNNQDQEISSILQDDNMSLVDSTTAGSPLPPPPPSLVLVPTNTTTTTSTTTSSTPNTTQSTIPYVFKPSNPPATAPMTDETLTDYLMITSKKDAYLIRPTATTSSREQQQWRMATIQRERRVVTRADARTAFVLDMMERLSFIEWIPELELCVMASQKGCVALMRILQVQLEGHQEQTCLFNHEKYLPLNGLQNSVLYGMTVHRLPSESSSSSPPVYQLLLLYLDGTMRCYRLSKPTQHNHSFLDLASVL